MNNPLSQESLEVHADRIVEGIVRRTVWQLQQMKAELSGDDSVLANVWDEICVQVQFQESIHWDAYDEYRASDRAESSGAPTCG